MAEGAMIIAFQNLGPYEARQLARAEQRRVYAARATQAVLQGLRASVNKLNHSLRYYGSELEATRAKIRQRDAREHVPEFTGRVYWGLIAVLLALEVPLNMAALDFLRRPELESTGMAIFVGAVTALAAKFTGRVICQAGGGHRALRDWGLALLYNVAFGFAIWRIAELRGELAGNASSGMTVLALQVTAYLAVVALSFAHADPDAEREQLTRLVNAQDRRLDRLWRNRNEFADRHNKKLADGELTLAEIEHDAIERLAEYRDCNMRRRSGPAPEYFLRPVTRMLFEPIELGTPLDAHPHQIGQIISDAEEGENE